jgi:TetR/AcrR family transcriptional regulator, cholesterol catabolism regulator
VFLFEWTFLEPERREAIARARHAYEGYFRLVIAEGVTSGELAARDPKLAAVFILSAMNDLAHWYRADGPLGPREIAERYADLLLHGLRMPAVPEPEVVAEGAGGIV